MFTRISKVLKAEQIKIPLEGKTKEEVMTELVKLLGIEEREEILRSSLSRESKMSTGIGKRVALPRYRGKSITGVKSSFGIHKEGVDFDSLDGNPVHFFFFVAAGEREEEEYIEVLSRMARILNQEGFQDHLLGGKNAKEILSLLKKEEEELWK